MATPTPTFEEVYSESLRIAIKEKLEKSAKQYADKMVEDIIKKMRQEASELASSAAVYILETIRIERAERELVIRVEIPEKK